MSSTSEAPPRRDLARRDLVGSALRTLPLLLFVALCAVVVRYARESTISADTYFHLRFGHEFLNNWALREPGSVTSQATREWLPTQWTAQVVMAWVEDRFGLAGVAWYTGAQILALAATLYWAARRYASALVAVLLAFYGLVAVQPALSGRPQVLSYIFVAVFTVAWFETTRDGRARWWLIPLTWVWATVHGMWPVGIVIGLTAWLGVVLDRSHGRRTTGRLLLVPVLCALAAAATPVGPGLYDAVLTVGSRASYFYEWATPDFTGRMGLMPAMMLALALVLCLRRGQTPFSQILLLGLAGAFVLYSIRTLPVAVAMLAPLLAHLAPARPAPRVGGTERAVVLLSLLASLIVIAVVVPRPPEPGVTVEEWADRELDELPSGTVLLNEQVWGGYLMWRHRQLDVVTHGYGDTFTTAELDRNVDIESVAAGWDDRLRETGASWALLDPENPLAYALTTTQDWVVVRASDEVALLRAPDGWFSAG